MKYFMLVLFMGLYMSSVAYGSDCGKRKAGNWATPVVAATSDSVKADGKR